MNQKNNRGFLGYSILLISIAVVIGLSYASYRLAAAEYVFGRSLKEAVANRGNETYKLMIEAIRLNPFENRYRISYSQTNLALANSIASKKDITDSDRRTIQQLVQQAIREGKAGVALNRLTAGNWANLANIYRNLINVATESDRWAIATYQQAIALDPNNPQLRLAYGQLLYSLNQFEPAQRQLEIATSLKPDLPNAHFNLGFTYKQQEKWLLAKAEFEQTLNLVDAKSQDYQTTKKELKEVNRKLEEKGLTATGEGKKAGIAPEKSQLQTPEEASPAAKLEPPIELPEKEAAPEITPSPSPQTTPSPSPEVSPEASPAATVSPTPSTP